MTSPFSPPPSAGLRDLFKQTTQRVLPKRIVAQIQSLAAEWRLE